MLDLVEAQTGTRPAALNLGPIDWRDVAIGVDAHIVWDSLFDVPHPVALHAFDLLRG